MQLCIHYIVAYNLHLCCTTMSFQQFIHSLLKRAKLKDSVIEEIWGVPKYRKMFEDAFTHKSFNSSAKSNYEKVETLGDLVINMAIVNYVIGKFPDIVSAHWLSNIKHRLISGKSFARFADEVGMFPHIKLSWEARDELEARLKEQKEKMGRSYLDDKIYTSLLEDVFEAFCGTLQLVVDDKSGLVAGPGYAVCYEFTKSFLDKIEIPRTVEEVFDPISRVKEIYDSNGWPSKTEEMTKMRKLENNDFQVTYVTTFPGQSRVTFLGTGMASNKVDARREAAINTLKILEEKYKITKRTKGRGTT